MTDLFFSFGNQHPGQLVLNNYPRFMQELSIPGNPVFDMGAVDLVRARERGVPRYNEFRRQLGLNPIRSFADLTDDKGTVATLAEVYGDNVENLDLLIGTLAETQRPTNFGFGETMFQIFILNASRRLQADRFYTDDYRPEVYTRGGHAVGRRRQPQDGHPPPPPRAGGDRASATSPTPSSPGTPTSGSTRSAIRCGPANPSSSATPGSATPTAEPHRRGPSRTHTVRELGSGDPVALVELFEAVLPGFSERLAADGSGPSTFLADPASSFGLGRTGAGLTDRPEDLRAHGARGTTRAGAPLAAVLRGGSPVAPPRCTPFHKGDKAMTLIPEAADRPSRTPSVSITIHHEEHQNDVTVL